MRDFWVSLIGTTVSSVPYGWLMLFGGFCISRIASSNTKFRAVFFPWTHASENCVRRFRLARGFNGRTEPVCRRDSSGSLFFFWSLFCPPPPPSPSKFLLVSLVGTRIQRVSLKRVSFFFYHKITPSKKVIFAIRPEHNDPLFLNVEDASEDAWDQWDASQKEIHTENEKWCSQNMVSCFNFQKCYRVYSSHSSNLWCL